MKNKKLKIGDNIIYIDTIEQLGESKDVAKLSKNPFEWDSEDLKTP